MKRMELLKAGDVLYDVVKTTLHHSIIQTLAVIPIRIMEIDPINGKALVRVGKGADQWMPQDSLKRFKKAPRLADIFIGNNLIPKKRNG